MKITDWINEWGDIKTPWEEHEDEDTYYDRCVGKKEYEMLSTIMGDEITAYFLIVKKSLFTSDDGEEVKISRRLEDFSWYHGEIHATCKLLNINYEEPSWWLTSEGYSST